MNGKIISSTQQETAELNYRVEIFEDEAFTELVGEANVIGSDSFSRERQYLNKTMIKRYAKSVANRKNPNLPWFINDELAQKYGISIELPAGITFDMKPVDHFNISNSNKPTKSSISRPIGSKTTSTSGPNQMSIEEYFTNSSAGFLAEERAADSLSFPQFNFPCDDGIVPVELIDSELKYPELVPMNQFITECSNSKVSSVLLTKSLEIWTFCQTFSLQLQLSPFPYDDWEEALTCTDPLVVDTNPLIEETFLALLSGLTKDRRNLTKGAYIEKLKSTILTFKSDFNIEDLVVVEEEERRKKNNHPIDVDDNETNEDDIPEIILSSEDSEEEQELFVKRSRKSSSKQNNSISIKKPKSLILPSIDLKKHRWYENRAMENWHFVLGSFLVEALDICEQFIEDELDEIAKAAEAAADEEMEIVDEDDSEYEGDDHNKSDKKNEKTESEGENNDNDNEGTNNPKKPLKQMNENSIGNSLEIMQNFVTVFGPITEKLVGKGSKAMFNTYLGLPLSAKLALLEFLVHTHIDRDTFKAFVEDCLERQGESRRIRKESEIEAQEAEKEVERLEARVQKLKDENLEITERLEADESDNEIELSEDEEKNSMSNKNNRNNEDEDEDVSVVKVKLPPLTEIERDELINQRTSNKKEITTLNASLRKIRPEASALIRKSEASFRDLRKCSSYRTFPLGSDRFSREYWWFGDFINPLPRLLIFNQSTQCWDGCIDREINFDLLMNWLNPLGIREAKLKAGLLEIENEIKPRLEARDLPFIPILEVSINKESTNMNTESGDESEEIDFEVFKRGRGRPAKGSTSKSSLNTNSNITNSNITPVKRPFQRYKNTL